MMSAHPSSMRWSTPEAWSPVASRRWAGGAVRADLQAALSTSVRSREPIELQRLRGEERLQLCPLLQQAKSQADVIIGTKDAELPARRGG